MILFLKEFLRFRYRQNGLQMTLRMFPEREQYSKFFNSCLFLLNLVDTSTEKQRGSKPRNLWS